MGLVYITPICKKEVLYSEDAAKWKKVKLIFYHIGFKVESLIIDISHYILSVINYVKL